MVKRTPNCTPCFIEWMLCARSSFSRNSHITYTARRINSGVKSICPKFEARIAPVNCSTWYSGIRRMSCTTYSMINAIIAAEIVAFQKRTFMPPKPPFLKLFLKECYSTGFFKPLDSSGLEAGGFAWRVSQPFLFCGRFSLVLNSLEFRG